MSFTENKTLQKIFFILRLRYLSKFTGNLRNACYNLQGMKIGQNTILPKVNVTWPHQVRLGSDCNLERGVFFKYDGIWNEGPSIFIGNNVFLGANVEFNISDRVEIGDHCLIASGCKFIDHDHGMDQNDLMRNQPNVSLPIILKSNVWLGCNVIVLKGVTIGENSVVAAGAVVNKSIPENEIWGGIPARKISQR
jgi:acetyltransferase-like isoleucine patch superfamily enzyme